MEQCRHGREERGQENAAGQPVGKEVRWPASQVHTVARTIEALASVVPCEMCLDQLAERGAVMRDVRGDGMRGRVKRLQRRCGECMR
jgi:hypothetical protein